MPLPPLARQRVTQRPAARVNSHAWFSDASVRALARGLSAPYISGMTEALEGKIVLTPAAIAEAKKKLADAPEGTLAFRVGLKGGGCAGYSYAYDFANKVREGKDRLLDFDGLAVVVDKKSLALLDGATLDFTRELMSYGFRWHNPHAVDACGCGESFDIKR